MIPRDVFRRPFGSIPSSVFRSFVFSLLVAVPDVNPLNAQTYAAAGAQFGINLADAHASPLADGVRTSSKTGLVAGALLDIGVGGAWSVMFAPRFVERGAELRYRDALVETALYNYVELPVSLKYAFDYGPIHPFIAGGASMGLLVSARYRTEFQRGYSTQYVMESSEILSASVEACGGVIADAGGGFSFIGMISYSHGLTNALRLPEAGEAAVWRSRDILIVAGMLYGF